ncbi:hypothetical protein [Agarivorans gilvus]|uniref:Uncharacterized protein n=1 Tax=Agarivorans gilvus TaxID=680279 RepID=A0ABQ1HZS0_9ALTE|nr:hypothetical protein [Agarivorans gilvus]GGA98892.1 hypothetical protein GCM10007414_09890 [Agarivorans gilvus]
MKFAVPIIDALSAILTSKIGLYSEALYKANGGKGQAVTWHKASLEAFKPKIVILGREHYQELSKEYSVPSIKELKALLSYESLDKNKNSVVFNTINRIEESRYKVNFWLVPATLMAELSKSAWWVLPESLLLATNQKLVSITTLSGQLYVASQAGGVTSSMDKLGCTSVEHFKWMSSLSAKVPLVDVTIDQYPALLLQRIYEKISIWPLNFRINKAKQNAINKQSVIKAALISSVLAGGYLAASSLYLGYTYQSLTKQYAQQSSSVSKYVVMQREVAGLIKQYEQGQTLLNDMDLSWRVWLVLLPIVDSSTSLTQVEFEENQVVIRGLSESASDVLSKISLQPGVVNAKFINAVSRQRDKERFAISFYLQDLVDDAA